MDSGYGEKQIPPPRLRSGLDPSGLGKAARNDKRGEDWNGTIEVEPFPIESYAVESFPSRDLLLSSR